MFCHLSPYCALAVGGGRLTQKLTFAVCPTPMGLGETTMKEYVGICHAGVCALVGISTVDDTIITDNNTAIKIAIVFLAFIFILLKSL
jgi:hypothetical protein